MHRKWCGFSQQANNAAISMNQMIFRSRDDIDQNRPQKI